MDGADFRGPVRIGVAAAVRDAQKTRCIWIETRRASATRRIVAGCGGRLPFRWANIRPRPNEPALSPCPSGSGGAVRVRLLQQVGGKPLPVAASDHVMEFRGHTAAVHAAPTLVVQRARRGRYSRARYRGAFSAVDTTPMLMQPGLGQRPSEFPGQMDVQ